MDMSIRRARPEDAPELAELMNLAGEGIPLWLWAQMAEPGEAALEFGARRVAGTEGGFSHVIAHVATSDGTIAGMLLGYRLPDPHEVGELDGVPVVIRPLLELEARAPGTWYVNAVATAAAHRRCGVGHSLMQHAERLAAETGATALSLIVAEENLPARTMYEWLGYRTIGRRPIIEFPGCVHTGDWVLMEKSVASQA